MRNTLFSTIALLTGIFLIAGCNQNAKEASENNATPETPRAEIRVTSVRGPAGSLYVDDGGDKGLTVIFIHSFAGDSTHWAAQLEHLRKSRRAIAFDLRGHGQSEPSAKNDYSIDSLASDAEYIVDTLNFDRVVLVGHSIGGAVALAYAGKHPEQVAGLVLVVAPGKVPPAEAQKIIGALESNYDKTMEGYWNQLVTNAQPKVVETLKQGRQKMPQDRSLNLIKATFQYDPSPALRSYQGPKLFVTAPSDNQPYALHNLAAGGEHKVIEGTSHWLQMDKPDEFNRILDEFLASVEAGRSQKAAQN